MLLEPFFCALELRVAARGGAEAGGGSSSADEHRAGSWCRRFERSCRR